MSNYPNQQPKKGMSCMAIGGIGCLVIIILLVAAGGFAYVKFGDKIWEKGQQFLKDPERATTMMLLENLPDFEIVKVDDTKREVTFKVKSTGEVVTATFKAVMEGNIKVVNGKADISGVKRVPAESSATAPSAAPAPAPQQ